MKKPSNFWVIISTLSAPIIAYIFQLIVNNWFEINLLNILWDKIVAIFHFFLFLITYKIPLWTVFIAIILLIIFNKYKSKFSKIKLSKEEENILVFVSKCHGKISESAMIKLQATSLNISTEKVKLYLVDLLKNNFVGCNYYPGNYGLEGDSYYYMKQKGRKYLNNKNQL